jgi:hypothetical protein
MLPRFVPGVVLESGVPADLRPSWQDPAAVRASHPCLVGLSPPPSIQDVWRTVQDRSGHPNKQIIVWDDRRF